MTDLDFQQEWHNKSVVKLFLFHVRVMGIDFVNGKVAFDFIWWRIWLHYKWFRLVNTLKDEIPNYYE